MFEIVDEVLHLEALEHFLTSPHLHRARRKYVLETLIARTEAYIENLDKTGQLYDLIVKEERRRLKGFRKQLKLI